jgi:hypothetical protein
MMKAVWAGAGAAAAVETGVVAVFIWYYSRGVGGSELVVWRLPLLFTGLNLIPYSSFVNYQVTLFNLLPMFETSIV